MTHYADLDPCTYHPPFHQDDWHCPALAIGWIEKDHPYINNTLPKHLRNEFTLLIGTLRDTSNPRYGFRGIHTCSLCDEMLTGSSRTLIIPGHKRIYITPARVDHYWTNHDYTPPFEFVHALSNCPPMNTDEYLTALKTCNGHTDIPLKA